MKRKALLAIIFAGSLLGSPMPAIAEPEGDTSNSLIQQFADSDQMKTEVRAFYLLSLANSYLSGDERVNVESRFADFELNGIRFNSSQNTGPSCIS